MANIRANHAQAQYRLAHSWTISFASRPMELMASQMAPGCLLMETSFLAETFFPIKSSTAWSAIAISNDTNGKRSL